jgi:DNA-directed RNA polymerase specialized sigma24 family protein
MSPESSPSPAAAALADALEALRPRLLVIVRRRLDASLAARIDEEDVLNEVFLRARERWDELSAGGPVTPFAWLYRIARIA